MTEPQTLAEMEARRRAVEERIAAAAHRVQEPESGPEPPSTEELLSAMLAKHWHGERWLLAEVLTVTCTVFQLPSDVVQGPERHTHITHARQAFMWLARRYCRFANGDVASFGEIGKAAGRDHTTACHAHHKITALVKGLTPPVEDTPVAWARKLREEALPVPIARVRRIRALAAQQMSRRAIAAELKCSCTTVDKALAA